MRFALTGRIGPTVRSFGWGLLDQMLSSFTNLVLNILVARAVSPMEFGAFGLAYAGYALILGATRALALDPLVVRFSAAPDERRRSAAGSAAATTLVIGAALGTVLVIAAAMATEGLRGALVVLGIALPGLLLQDAWRYSFFAAGRGDQAFWNDFVWAAALFPAVALVIATDNQSTASLMIAWAGSGWLAAAVGLAQGGIRPRFPHAISWLREQRDLTFRYFGEFVISSGATQLSVFLVGALATLADVGRLRAGQIILGPLNVLFQGAGLVAVAETSRLLANSPGKLDHAIFGISGVLAAGSLAWAVIALMVPSSVGQALMGGNWAGGQALLVPLTISILGYALAYGPMTGLRALAAAPASLRARIFDSTALLLMSTVGAATAGATGVAWGHAVMGCLRVPNWWWHFRKARREYSAPRAEDPTGG